MKKSLLLIIFTLGIVLTNAQEIEENSTELKLTEVIPFEGTIEDIRNELKSFFATYYVNSNVTSRDAGMDIIYSGKSLITTEVLPLLISKKVYANHIIKIQFKENRLKVSISISEFEVVIDNKSHTHSWTSLIDLKNTYPRMYARNWNETIETTKIAMRGTLEDIKATIKNKETNDNW